MESNDEILNELEAVSPILASIEKKQVYLIPDKYFNYLKDNILEKRDMPVLTPIPKTNPNIPSGYFNDFPADLLKLINLHGETPAEEIRMRSPLLYAIQSENPLVTPPDYFNELPAEILLKVKPEARISRMKKWSSAWQYARAAVVTGIIAISALMVYNTQSPFGIVSGKTEYIESRQYKNEKQINEGISKLSDEEIIKYLENSGNASDNETLNSSLDEITP